MTKNKHVPQRTCNACRVQGNKSDFIRIVRSPEGKAVIDVTGKLPGRGAYICPDSECISRAKKSGVLSSAINAAADEAFWEELESCVKNFGLNIKMKICSIMGLARKAGALLIGIDRIKASKHKALLICAADCSESVKSFAESHENITPGMNTEELSNAAGSRGGIQVIGLPLSSGFAKKILSLYKERGSAFE